MQIHPYRLGDGGKKLSRIQRQCEAIYTKINKWSNSKIVKEKYDLNRDLFFFSLIKVVKGDMHYQKLFKGRFRLDIRK